MTDLPAPKPILSAAEGVAKIADYFGRENVRDAIAAAVPAGTDPSRIVRLALQQIETNESLRECEPFSLACAIIECVSLGLEPGVLSQAWLVPFAGKAQLIPGYRGLAQLAYQHPKVIRVHMGTVFPDDVFEVDEGAGLLSHKPKYDGDRSVDPVCYYGIVSTIGGGHVFRVLTLLDVLAIRDGLPKRQRESLMWTKHFHEAGMKSALRRAMKLAPMTTQAQRAVALDEMAEMGKPQDFRAEIDVTPEAEPEDTRERDPETNEPIPDSVGRQTTLIPPDEAESAERF